VLKIGRVIASASRKETVDFAKGLGADETINHRNPLADELATLGVKVLPLLLSLIASPPPGL
jgi:NADPH:quinone reductase-like Zn-dependent oxidoreductase